MQLYQAVHGGPQPGITQKVDAVLKELHLIEGRDREKQVQQEERHIENTEKLDTINNKIGTWGIWVAAFGVFLAACAIAVTITIFVIAHNRASMSFPDFLLQHLQGQEYADKQQPSQTAVDVSLR